MPDVLELVDEHRRRLLRRERAVLAAIEASYDAAAAEAAARLAALQAAGAMQLRIDRMTVLLVQIEAQVQAAGSQSVGIIEAERRAMVIAAAADWEKLAVAIDVAVGIDVGAAEQIQALLAQGSPLSQLLAGANAAGLEAAKAALFNGIILGDNPLKIARALRAALEISKHRAQTIARTETLRAYRNAILERMRATSGVVGWVWISARDRRTCPMCWAMHGTKHRLSERFGTHPSCRCSQAPLPADPQFDIRPGAEDFAGLSLASQRAILGPGKFAAYQQGALSLPDLVGTASSQAWGLVRYEKPLKAVTGGV